MKAAPQPALRGHALVLERKKEIVLLVVTILTAASLAFSVASWLIRGAGTDLLIFGLGSLVFFGVTFGLRHSSSPEVPATLALIPVTLLIPLSVIFPLPTQATSMTPFALATGGTLSVAVATLIGNRRWQILLPGLATLAITIVFYAVVMYPAFGGTPSGQWAFTNFIASLLIQGIVLAALLHLQRIVDYAFHQTEMAYDTLEDLVSQRTKELEEANLALTTTLDHLTETQAQLVLTERLKLLGELVAGVSHEINTPLGAIVSASGTMRDALGDTLRELVRAYSSLPGHDRMVLQRLLPKLRLATALSNGQRRDVKSRIVRRLTELGQEQPESVADAISHLDWDGDDEGLKKLIDGSHRESVAQVLYNVATLHTLTDIVFRSAERISDLTRALRENSDFRDVSSMEPFALHRSLNSVLTLMKYPLNAGIELEKALDESVQVLCHPGRLGQVWMNLIQNAIQAMDGRGSLALTLRRDGADAVVEVANQGPEIPHPIRAKIFEPFVTSRERGKGTGLGLAISKQIVEQHHGQISFESTPERTTFTVRLPALV